MHIVQSGAVPPLIEIEMLQSPEPKLREMAAFALGRLAHVFIFNCSLLISFFGAFNFVVKHDSTKPPLLQRLWNCFRLINCQFSFNLYPSLNKILSMSQLSEPRAREMESRLLTLLPTHVHVTQWWFNFH